MFNVVSMSIVEFISSKLVFAGKIVTLINSVSFLAPTMDLCCRIHRDISIYNGAVISVITDKIL